DGAVLTMVQHLGYGAALHLEAADMEIQHHRAPEMRRQRVQQALTGGLEGTLARGPVEPHDADRVAFLHRIDEQPGVHLLRRPELAIKRRALELRARHREILEL